MLFVGGVCALVSKQIQICKVDVDKPFDHLEILCFDVVCRPSNLRFTLVYRPSSGVESDACMSDLVEFLKSHHRLDCMNVIAGDFNCPKISWDNLQCSTDRTYQLLLSCVIDCGLTQVVDFNTRLQNVLDSVLTDERQRILKITSKPPLGP